MSRMVFQCCRDKAAPIFVTFALIFSASAVAQVPDKPDTSFLKEQPYLKMKRRVDLSGVESKEDIAVIKDGINPILFFFASIAIPLHVSPERLNQIATPEGAQRLRLPPPAASGRGRYISTEKFNWRVTGDSMIVVTANFTDIYPSSPVYSDTFVFVKQGCCWKFDHHE